MLLESRGGEVDSGSWPTALPGMAKKATHCVFSALCTYQELEESLFHYRNQMKGEYSMLQRAMVQERQDQGHAF